MSNITENRLNEVITAVNMTHIGSKLLEVINLLPIGSLDDEQREKFRAIDVDNKVFVEDVITEMGLNSSGIIPAFINATFIQNDLALFEQLDSIEASVLNICRRISDLKRIAGHEAYNSSNTVYKIYDAASLAGVPGAKSSYDKLKLRYNSQGRTALTQP